MDTCKACGDVSLRVLRDFGAQPPSNLFLKPADSEEPRHPLILGQCQACGLLQLIDPMPAGLVKARYEWLTYNEPEAHLDDVAAMLARLSGIGVGAEIHGVTYKDDSILARLSRLGFSSTRRYDVNRDLNVVDRCAGLETIQDAFDSATVARLVQSYGPADVLIARHIVEHAHDPASFIRAVAGMLKPSGYLVFEFPDCTKFVKACDYSFLWEEHIVYFSLSTFAVLAERSGFRVHEIRSYSYALEDSIVAILQPIEPADATVKPRDLQQLERELRLASSFASQFENIKSKYRNKLTTLCHAGKRVALFGGSHLAAKFVNLFGLQEYVQCVIDDNPHKQGLLMPGSRLPIVGSMLLFEQAIDVCLLSLNPASERQVLTKYHAFVEHGGQFYSIFPLSSIALVP